MERPPGYLQVAKFASFFTTDWTFSKTAASVPFGKAPGFSLDLSWTFSLGPGFLSDYPGVLTTTTPVRLFVKFSLFFS